MRLLVSAKHNRFESVLLHLSYIIYMININSYKS